MCSLAFASCQVPASPYKVEDMSQEEFFFFSFWWPCRRKSVNDRDESAYLKTSGDTHNVVLP